MTRPFDKGELAAGVTAVERRPNGAVGRVISIGELRVDIDAQTVEVNGEPVHLTGKEFQILELLALGKGSTLTKEMLLNQLYAGMSEPDVKILDVFICNLRRKLKRATGGRHYIETVWGRGYVMSDPGETRINSR